MKLAVAGTGYVGLVTGVCLAEVGHQVTCVDIDEMKIQQLKEGIPPIYEPGLTEMMQSNVAAERLRFTSNFQDGFEEADVIFIAVGTPQNTDGSANLTYVEEVAKNIASTAHKDTLVVTKSTVSVGTNNRLQEIINLTKLNPVKIEVVSNPEFLREGSAIYDTFHGDRIVIGVQSKEAAQQLEEIYEDFHIPIYQTDLRSAEMIKYAANAFLATKISFINEIANICERVGANVEEVATGMGLDKRIGSTFLKAGIGYGGSCFPKDTNALMQIAGNVAYEFELLKGVINVNRKQQIRLLDKLKQKYESLTNKRIAVLGLAFKPNTDDIREAASILVINELVREKANVIAYDPVAMDNAKQVLSPTVNFASTIEEALVEAEAVLIFTEWDEIKTIDLNVFAKMKTPFVLDGRNCFALESVKDFPFEYHSIGRPALNLESENLLI